jgi:hypothetical protein
MKNLTVIGRAEKADFPLLGATKVPVKIDTGADACSIWATATELENGRLHVVFFGEGSPWFTGDEHIFMPNEYTVTRVANSFGHRELRYKVKLGIKVKRRLIRGSFTLSDRSTKLYPVLLGRTLLKNKFLVDVSKGSALREEEKARVDRLRTELEQMEGTDV